MLKTARDLPKQETVGEKRTNEDIEDASNDAGSRSSGLNYGRY